MNSENGLTLFDKIWNAHRIRHLDDGRDLIFVDRHVLQETTSAQAFDNLRKTGRSVRYPDLTVATQDHIVSTMPGRSEDSNPTGRELMQLMRSNARSAGIRHYGVDHPSQGIVHVIAPELGLALPGSILACGDSHTSTVGGLGCLGIGVGTSEVEHVLATQTLVLSKPKPMRIWYEAGLTAKDLILHTIGQIGVAGGRGFAVEYAGPVIEALSIEARLTLCNMSIELGARLGFIAPDDKTIAYLENREFAPKGSDFAQACIYWRGLQSDPQAEFEKEVHIDCTTISHQVSWGTTPEDVVSIDGVVPDPGQVDDPARRERISKAIRYMDLNPGQKLSGLPINIAFIGSCTNSRLSDLTLAASLVRGRHVAANVRALVVPGSMSVKREAEALGLDVIFREAGFEWRDAGCSMCVSINEDVVPPGARCIATTNRNFENRQGPKSRTHIASPAVVAAAALAGCIPDSSMIHHKAEVF
jgi:3-isopropylmalate/(R)-2-methylmalate dehydratase large subunit